jgi:hypothetical protein
MRKLCVVGSIMASCLFAGGSLLLSDSVNASEVTMPFYLVDFGHANPVPVPDNPCELSNTEMTSGFALPIGAFTLHEQEIVRFLSCSPPSPPGSSIEVSGKFQIFPSSGNEIDGELHTTGTFDSVNGVIVQGSFRFVSGTGQFANVKGSGIILAHGAPPPATDLVGAFIGTISYGGN